MAKTLIATCAALLFMTSLPAAAHSIEDVETSLHERDKYAQFVDRPAPGFSLTNAAGEKTSLAGLQDKVVVLNFLYTRCTEVCPTHMNLIAQLQDSINAKGLQDQVEFITVATDTEAVAETRENMRDYAENFQFDPANWRFLARAEGEPPRTTMALAEDYGLTFSIAEDGVQIHGIVTHVIDQTGRMRARFHGLEFEPEHLVAYVEALARPPEERPDGFFDRVNHYFEDLFREQR